MLTAAAEEAGALIAKPRPEIIRPDAPAAQWELAAERWGGNPPEAVDVVREALRLVEITRRPERSIDSRLWALARIPGDAAASRVPNITTDPADAFAWAFSIAPGWLFLSLAQEVSPIVNRGDRIEATGRWVCKLQAPEGGRLKLGIGEGAALAICNAALMARLDDLTRTA